jgi:hypothetical protein
VPLWPRNHQLLLLYPRHLQTTAGTRDRAAPPDVVGGAMRYADEIWALAGLGERLLFRTDDGDHNYGRSRREETYEWFARSLLGEAPGRRTERSLPLLPSELLEPDITGTGSLADDMRAVALAERARRFAGSVPLREARRRAAAAARQLFGRPLEHFRSETVWRGRFAGIRAQAIRLHGTSVDVPVVELQGKGPRGTGTLFLLPERGTAAALDLLRERAQCYERVVSADYLGIGELASDRMLLHTIAWSLMQADESLPTLNVALLRGVLLQIGSGPVDVEGRGWAPSLYAGALRALEPGRVRRVIVTGVPADELRRLGRGKRVPDLLLHPGLFLHMTAAELAD